MAYFLEASMIASQTTFMAASSSGNILCRIVALRMTLLRDSITSVV